MAQHTKELPVKGEGMSSKPKIPWRKEISNSITFDLTPTNIRTHEHKDSEHTNGLHRSQPDGASAESGGRHKPPSLNQKLFPNENFSQMKNSSLQCIYQCVYWVYKPF